MVNGYFNNRRDFKTHKISTSVIPTGYKFNKVEEKIKSFGLSCIRLVMKIIKFNKKLKF